MKSRLSWASKRWLLLYLELDPSDWRQNWKCGPSSIWYQRLSTLPPFKRYQPAGCFRPWVWDMDEPWYGPWFTATSIIVINADDWKVARLAWTTDKGWINWGKIPRTWLLECSAILKCWLRVGREGGSMDVTMNADTINFALEAVPYSYSRKS